MGIKYVNLNNERIGKVNSNRYGSLMKIVRYDDALNVWVKFDQGEPIRTAWSEFTKGEVKNSYDRTIYGVGFIGEGRHRPSLDNVKTFQYECWRNMILRCYDEKFLKKHPTYKDCYVCEQWHNFQNFAEWFEKNYYVSGERMNLDKDILIKGNKVYSPTTCIFVPQVINLLFVKNDSIRGDLPIGVHFDKQTNKFKSQCKIGNGKMRNLGRFTNLEEAFFKYKAFKEGYIKEVADKYKDKIPLKLYQAMCNYKVEMND